MPHCSICGSPNTNASTCPMNQNAKKYDLITHPMSIPMLKELATSGDTSSATSGKSATTSDKSKDMSGGFSGSIFDFLYNNNEKSLYDRLGGSFPISAVVNKFSDQLLTNPVVGANSPNLELSQWHKEDFKTRLPGLKFLRTLWVCSVAGGPFDYTGQNLRDAHYRFHISPDEFDATADELGIALDYYKVPEKEKQEVLAAFNAQKKDVTAGYYDKDQIRRKKGKEGTSAVRCPFGHA